MNYHLTFFFLLFLTSLASFSQESEQQARKHLMDLVNERKERFDEFNKAIETRSGIFGNQTKKDLKAANEVLRDIVKTDNRIIFELQRLLEHKSYEKTAETYVDRTNTAKLESYLTAIGNLNKKNNELVLKNKDLSRQMERSSVIFWIIIILAFALITYLVIRLRKAKRSSLN